MINDEIGKILGIRIGKGDYKASFDRLDRMGGLNMKTLIEMNIVLCLALEEIQSDLKLNQMKDGKEISIQSVK